MRNNTIRNPRAGRRRANGITCLGNPGGRTDYLIEGNRISGARHGMILGGLNGATIQGNVVERSARVGIYLCADPESPDREVEVSYNTVLGSGIGLGEVDGVVLRHNLLVGKGRQITGYNARGVDSDWNIMVPAGSSFPEGRRSVVQKNAPPGGRHPLCGAAARGYRPRAGGSTPGSCGRIIGTGMANWARRGLIVPRQAGWGVAGDPSIVWDEEIKTWRMVMFYAPPGTGEAICPDPADPGKGPWKFLGPLKWSNPDALIGGSTHKPFVVMEARKPNVAARVDGKFWLVTVSHKDGSKVVQRAHAEKLAGPWTLEEGILIDTGGPGEFDEKHADAVTGFWFENRDEFLYFYMGYPKTAQDRKISPYGNASAVAAQKRGEPKARKLGVVLPPCQEPGHWASGWVGGVQILPGREHRWEAIVNASPAAPDPEDKSESREEPPPSLGGFAYCDEEWPVKGWTFSPQPIEWIEDIPKGAIENGEGVNLWRQHILVLPDGRYALYYNSGTYGKEQMYGKEERKSR